MAETAEAILHDGSIISVTIQGEGPALLLPARLEPFASGIYVNVLSDEGSAGVSRAYSPEKLARLTALKDDYDPDNVFHLNQNFAPSA